MSSGYGQASPVERLRLACASALALTEPAAKCRAVADLTAMAEAIVVDGEDPGCDLSLDPPAVGRPPRPPLVAPSDLPRRRLGSASGRAALLHAIAHIEFNAINLALDAVCRFSGLPSAYYRDWASVAVDEARHFRLLQDRLTALDSVYGEFPAHDGLWEMARRTASDCLLRMALVPRVLEARGLDVTPGMIRRLADAGDEDSVAVLEIILREEVRHVAIGSHWFRWCCEQRDLAPEATFRRLLEEHYRGGLKPPFNETARRAAGFSRAELTALAAMGNGDGGPN